MPNENLSWTFIPSPVSDTTRLPLPGSPATPPEIDHAPLSSATPEEYFRRLNETLDTRIAESLESQAQAQSNIETHLKEEAVTRSKDDRKYFWLGVLTSFVISMLVEHGSALIRLLQGLLPG